MVHDSLLSHDAHLTQAWGWILKAHLRSGRTRPDPNDPTAYRDDPGPEVRFIYCFPLSASQRRIRLPRNRKTRDNTMCLLCAR